MMSAEQNRRLTEVGADKPMGQLLRRYWIPFAGASEFDQTPVRPVRLLGEDLVAYRDLDGHYGLLDKHCPHRRANLAYGFVERCGLRCSYHGWLMNHDGTVSAIPYDETVNPDSRLKDSVTTRAYPVREVAGLLFTYMGPSPAPELPIWGPFNWTGGFCEIVRSNIPCNWLQCQENAIDPVHFEWMHDNWSQRLAGSHEYSAAHTKIAFEEVEYGHVYRRIREGQEEGSELWTNGRLVLWPMGFFLGEHFEWHVPIDDENTLNISWFHNRLPKGAIPYEQASIPTWESPIKDLKGEWITSHVINQDIVAWVGQGRIADRTKEHLALSDRGVVMLRRAYFDEMTQVESGLDPRWVLRDPERARDIPLPYLGRTIGGDQMTLEQWQRHPYLKLRLVDHRHCAGQPKEVREALSRAMGIES
jgi:5,5'-dehydrodivanillate O-demethylase